jgi:hypothetical protein
MKQHTIQGHEPRRRATPSDNNSDPPYDEEERSGYPSSNEQILIAMLYSEDNTTTNQNSWPLFWHGSDTSSPAFSLSNAAGKAAAAIASAIERARTGIDPSASQTVAMREGPGTERDAQHRTTTTTTCRICVATDTARTRLISSILSMGSTTRTARGGEVSIVAQYQYRACQVREHRRSWQETTGADEAQPGDDGDDDTVARPQVLLLPALLPRAHADYGRDEEFSTTTNRSTSFVKRKRCGSVTFISGV